MHSFPGEASLLTVIPDCLGRLKFQCQIIKAVLAKQIFWPLAKSPGWLIAWLVDDPRPHEE
jgi:hypothetical protein